MSICHLRLTTSLSVVNMTIESHRTQLTPEQEPHVCTATRGQFIPKQTLLQPVQAIFTTIERRQTSRSKMNSLSSYHHLARRPKTKHRRLQTLTFSSSCQRIWRYRNGRAFEHELGKQHAIDLVDINGAHVVFDSHPNFRPSMAEIGKRTTRTAPLRLWTTGIMPPLTRGQLHPPK